jgi:hypothetical protein
LEFSWGLAAMGGGGPYGAGSAGAAVVRAECGMAVFLTVHLTDVVGVLNRSNSEWHAAATARSTPRLQRRGGGIGADEDLVDTICRLVPAL